MAYSRVLRQLVVSGVVLFLLSGPVSGAEIKTQVPPFIAGVHPDQRRTDIPVITRTMHNDGWHKRALTGISQPVPQNILDFIKDQGDWYSPFLWPGMHGRYDIRGWHGSSGK